MADNIMGGYGSSDITANIELNLNNIDRSTQDAAALASQLKDWGSSIEAATKQLQDYNTAQGEMLETAGQLAETQERILEAARQLKELSASSNVNFRDMAQNAHEINRAISGLSGGGEGYTPGVSSTTPASVVDGGGANVGYGMPGAPEATPADFGMSGGGSLLDNLVTATMMGNTGGGKGRRGSGRANAPVSTKGILSHEEMQASYGESMAKKMLGINYWMPGGKVAALGRYIDRLSGGRVTEGLGGMVSRHPRIFGTPGSEFGGPGSDAFTQAMMEQGIGPMTAEQAAMLPESVAASVMPEIGGAAIAAEAAGGLGIAGTAGLLGTLGSAAVALAPVAAAGYLGMQAYGAYANYQRQGQVLGSLTGENNASKMVGMETNDFFKTLFNPLMSYGAAKEIQMTGLAAGFQGDVNGLFNGGTGPNAGLLGQYTGFAGDAYQQYGMSPQESLQMFNSSVIAAGATVQQLTTALNGLANTSATTGASFAQLKANFTYSTNLLGGLGFQGAMATDLAAGMSLANVGNSQANTYLRQQDIGGTGMMLETMPGLALTAQAAGMSFTQAFSQMGTQSGAAALAGATNTAVLNVIKNSLGIYPGMPGLQAAIDNNLYQIYVILSSLMPMGPDGKGAQWTPQAARDWITKAMTNGGSGESISGASAQSITKLYNQLTGGKTGETGITNSISAIAGKLGASANLSKTGLTAEVNVGGNWETLGSIQYDSLKQQQQIFQDMLSGKDKLRTFQYSPLGQSHYQYGSSKSVGDLFGVTALQGINNGTLTQNQMQIELGPRAAALFELINNPQKLTNAQLKMLAGMGLDVNTRQNTGWMP